MHAGSDGFFAGEPGAPDLAEIVPLGEDRCIRLPEFLERGSDAVGQRAQLVDVEAVEVDVVQAEHPLGFVNGHVPEAFLQELAGVRPRAFGVREVVSPHDVVDADLVPASDFPPARVRRTDLDVAVEVVARLHRQVREPVGRLPRAVVPVVGVVEHPEEVGGPEAPRFRHRELQARETLERARAQQEPERPRRPPPRLGDVHAVETLAGAVVLVRAGAGVRVHRHVELFAHGPDRVVDVVRVRRVRAPLRRDEHAAVQARLVGAPDLRDRAGNVAQDGRHREALAPLGGVRAQVGAPTVVRACAGEEEHGIEVGADHETGTERSAHAAGRRVGAREDHFGGHAVVVELLVALRRVPPAAQPAFMEALLALLVPEPLLLELVVAAHHQRAALLAHLREERFALDEGAVERVAVLGIDVGLVVGRLRTGVAVGRDDEVVVHRVAPVTDQECGRRVRRRSRRHRERGGRTRWRGSGPSSLLPSLHQECGRRVRRRSRRHRERGGRTR